MALEISDSQTSVKIPHFQEVARTQINRKWSREPFQCTSEDLEALTDNFKEEYLIGQTTYGKVYRGKIKLDSTGAETRGVIVKIWDDKVDPIDDGKVVEEEVKFLSFPCINHHRNLATLIAFYNTRECAHGNGVVYDLNPLDSLYNHTPKDDFSWIQRIKVALEFAKLLEFLHDWEFPYLLFNIDSTNIMLDQEHNPIVIDFGLVNGGLMGGPRFSQQFGYMSYGYCDSYYCAGGATRGPWSDVFSYGLILLGLIAKRIDLKEDIGKLGYKTLDEWASQVYKPPHCCSLVHTTLMKDEYYDESDGIALTELAMSCIQQDKPHERPPMVEIVYRLKKLCAFRAPPLSDDGLGGDEDAHKHRRMKLGGANE